LRLERWSLLRPRREFLVTSAAAGATLLLPGKLSAAPSGKQTYAILHTNHLRSNLIEMSPSEDYTPFTLNDDMIRGGYARLVTLIANTAEFIIPIIVPGSRFTNTP
jgi:2',3'-cyclic-nucleotide 2'-phosphodiesterase (5'-nucleotidase family)